MLFDSNNEGKENNSDSRNSFQSIFLKVGIRYITQT